MLCSSRSPGTSPKSELEIERQPLLPVPREVLEPGVQVPPDRRQFVLPDALHRRHQLVVSGSTDLLDDLVQDCLAASAVPDVTGSAECD